MKLGRRFIALMAATALTLSLAACGGGGSGSTSKKGSGATTESGEEVIDIIFANVTSESAKRAGEKFKEVAEAESNGTLNIKLFPDNQLADDRVAIESTQFGDIDIGVSSTSPIATMYADFYLFDAPYLFLSPEEAYSSLDGPVGQKILTGLEDMGLKGLCLWENGFRNYTNNKVAAKSPDDMKNFKVRTMENEVHLAAWTAWGTNPTPMAFTELFTALQQGTVDAEENPLGIIDANKFYEVQDYVSLTQHVYTPYVVCMNLDRYNSLTDEQRAAIDKAAEESTKYQREQSAQLETEILEKFETEGITVVELTTEEKAVFQQIVEDNNIYDLVKKNMDHPEYVDEILNAR